MQLLYLPAVRPVQDVTAQYVDAAARQANLEAARAQLEKLLSTATTVSDTLEVSRPSSSPQGDSFCLGHDDGVVVCWHVGR